MATLLSWFTMGSIGHDDTELPVAQTAPAEAANRQTSAPDMDSEAMLFFAELGGAEAVPCETSCIIGGCDFDCPVDKRCCKLCLFLTAFCWCEDESFTPCFLPPVLSDIVTDVVPA